MTDMKGSTSTNQDIHALQKEWDEVACPICMDHPHNAVLLICTSHEKGCRSYICDTSDRHSNCLDRFRKLRMEHSDNNNTQPISSLDNSITETLGQRGSSTLRSEPFLLSPRTRGNSVEILEGMYRSLGESNSILRSSISDTQSEERIDLGEAGSRNASEKRCLKCPLCRGTVISWMIVKEARRYLDLKSRSCSCESCSFSGNYEELRGHARRVHPMERPTDVDPLRQQSWLNLEHQRNYGDIISAIRSRMPGASVLGDYVIDDRDELPLDQELEDASVPWWATLFLFHMMSNSVEHSHDDTRSLPRTRRSRDLLSLQGNDNDDIEDVLMPRIRRQRLSRSSFGDETQ